MIINIVGLKNLIDEVIIGGKVLTPKEQKELLSNAYYLTVEYYIMKRNDNQAAYIASLKAQIKGLVIDGVSISDLDRNALLTSMYAKALEYTDAVTAFNLYFRAGYGPEPIIKPTPGTTSFLDVNFTGYYLVEW